MLFSKKLELGKYRKNIFIRRTAFGVPLLLTSILASVCVVVFSFLLGGGTSANAAEPICPNRLSPGFRMYLPDCRAYELVSPTYKEGVSLTVEGTGRLVGVSENGGQILVETLGSLANAEGAGLLGTDYFLTRSPNSWEAAPLEAPLLKYPTYEVAAVTPNFKNSLWLAALPGQFASGVYVGSSGDSLSFVGPGAPPLGQNIVLGISGASKDLLHDLFTAHSPQHPGEHTLWPGDHTLSGVRPSLYEYVGTDNVEPTLVGVDNERHVAPGEEADLISDCGTTLGGPGFPEGDRYNAISETGETVFFTAEASASCSTPTVDELYARVHGEKTVAISEPSHPLAQGSGPGQDECDSICAAAGHMPGTFAGASADGSKVFFLTTQPLLNSDTDAGNDLYEAEIEGEGQAAHVGRLLQISHDSNAAQAAEVQGVVRVSEDGSHVYFVAKGVLTSEPRGGECLKLLSAVELAEEELTGEGPCRAKDGGNNLYVYQHDSTYPNGHVSFISTLSLLDQSDWQENDVRPAQATPDGDFLVFQSVADLTPDEHDAEEAGQVFEYNAQSEALLRVSQGRGGYNDNGNSNLYSSTLPTQDYETTDQPASRFLRLAISADGSVVVFSSEDALTPQALNGVNNVYAYGDGQVSLISDGHDATRLAKRPATELIGTDESGQDIFFTTADALVPQDTDTQVDLYDARVNGGFPVSTVPTPCSEDSCQNSPSTAPLLLTPGVTSSSGEPTPAVTNTDQAVKGATHRAKKTKLRKKHKAVIPRKHGVHGSPKRHVKGNRP